eukprot:TRINITY_DN20280_c0_g1_i2.p1 TRINITY_DN20280_c0_g1~~TRINITY_DN20280_c0_g1_i2.p1  ORF type:complete len:251 (+),score=28.61 TRINITY_DN20280_c0_g1_i2:1109-1861(+)
MSSSLACTSCTGHWLPSPSKATATSWLGNMHDTLFASQLELLRLRLVGAGYISFFYLRDPAQAQCSVGMRSNFEQTLGVVPAVLPTCTSQGLREALLAAISTVPSDEPVLVICCNHGTGSGFELDADYLTKDDIIHAIGSRRGMVVYDACNGAAFDERHPTIDFLALKTYTYSLCCVPPTEQLPGMAFLSSFLNVVAAAVPFDAEFANRLKANWQKIHWEVLAVSICRSPCRVPLQSGKLSSVSCRLQSE